MTIYISQVLAVYVNIRAAHSSTRSLMGSNVTSKLRWQLRYCGVGSTGSQYGYVSTWSRPLNEPSLITTISAAKYVLWPWKIEKMMSLVVLERQWKLTKASYSKGSTTRVGCFPCRKDGCLEASVDAQSEGLW